MTETLTLRQTRETVLDEEGRRVWNDLDAENNGTPQERIAVVRARLVDALRRGRRCP
jgi:hypothetical protein